MKKFLHALLAKSDKERAIDEYVQSVKSITTMTLLVQAKNGKIIFDKSKGGLTKDKPFAIASISKLYTYAIIFNLIDSDKLSYNDKLSKFFSDSFLKNLHTINGVDYAPGITLRQLLDQTSGFPDYETDKQLNGEVIFNEIMKRDKTVDFKTSVAITKKLTPKFIPDSKKRAYYSNMNVNLLAEIAEKITQKSYEELLTKYVTKPLGLQHTYSCMANYQHEPIYFKSRSLVRPKYLSGSVASGGIIATNAELMVFIRAFFEGKLFNKKHIADPAFRPIQFFPLQYGSGLMKVEMSRAMSPFFPAPTLVGHSGSSGSFAYYCANKEVYVTGTINQIKVRPFSLIYMYLSTL
jgi:D-alanyl-D-alanine carboxypeptidase